MEKLTQSQRETLLAMPDCGGVEAWKLDKRSLPNLVRRGLAVREHIDGMGEKIFDRYSRTTEGRVALWGEDQRPMIGKYVADYAPLTKAEMNEPTPELDALIERSKPVLKP